MRLKSVSLRAKALHTPFLSSIFPADSPSDIKVFLFGGREVSLHLHGWVGRSKCRYLTFDFAMLVRYRTRGSFIMTNMKACPPFFFLLRSSVLLRLGLDGALSVRLRGIFPILDLHKCQTGVSTYSKQLMESCAGPESFFP